MEKAGFVPRAAAANSAASFEPQAEKGFNHVHVDSRSKTGPGNNWGGTSDWPDPCAGQPNGCPLNWEYY